MSKRETNRNNDEEFSQEDLRILSEESRERDERNGYDLENCTYRGKDQTHQIVEEPYKKHYPWSYVKLEDGSFRFSPRLTSRQPNLPNQRIGMTLPHSMLARGKPVIGAGECETDENGKVISIDNFSGHYKPGEKNLKETKKNMESKGLSTPLTQWILRRFDGKGNVIKEL
ncbi:MAG TPA: hypothetical protein DD379_04670 [Cyanobacteria bacterium UBA11162]|nr:hypothetical protein [Cyanobacteria bacterium UBA11162]